MSTVPPDGGMAGMPEFASQKPIAINADGSFVRPAELQSGQAFGVTSLLALEETLQQRLTLERIALDPTYELGIFILGRITKDEALAHVQARTELGRTIINAEINYCNEYTAQLMGLGGAQLAQPTPMTPMTPVTPVLPPWKKGKKVPILVQNTVLFCEDTCDPLTSLAAKYRKEHVHPAFAKAGFELIVLEGASDVRDVFAAKAKSAFVTYISGVGHGGPGVYTGCRSSRILEVGAYLPAEVDGKVIHLLSCQTAKQLGPNMVVKGLSAYAGYYENFIFTTAPQYVELFWRCDSTFDIGIATSMNVGTAYDATIAAYNLAIASVPNTVAATFLTHDRNFLRSPSIDAIYGKSQVVRPAKRVIWITLPFALEEMSGEQLEELSVAEA
jgi:hypothetical protein